MYIYIYIYVQQNSLGSETTKPDLTRDLNNGTGALISKPAMEKNNMNMRKYEKSTMMVIEHDSAKRLRLKVDASESHLGISQDILTYINCVKRKT